MAKASVKLTCKECGCTFTSTKQCYNRADADEYEEWAAQNITTCPACYKAARQAAKEERVMAEAEKLSLPELTGSDKQIKWAISIRSDMLRKYSLSDGFAEGKTVDDLRTVIDDAIAGKIEATESDITWMRTALALLTETSAKWFIEHRYE